MRKGICVAGSIIVDHILEIEKYPGKGELVKILNQEKSCGGLVPNVAIDLKRIDANLPVYACGKIADDEDGRFVSDMLRKEGVDCSNVRIDNSCPTSYTDVMSEGGGERTFFNLPGSSSQFGFDDIDPDALDCQFFHLGYFLLLDKIDNGDGLKILKALKDRGIVTSIDFVTEAAAGFARIVPCLEYVDNLIINEIEACRLSGVESDVRLAMTRLKEMGVRDKVIVHEPSRGRILSENGYLELPSFNLPCGYVKGTTGAGDAFCAGALYSIAKGCSDMEILEFASMAAAVSLASQSATGAMMSESEIRKECSKFDRICL